MADYFDVNKEFWNASTPLHLGPGEWYDIEAFKKQGLTLTPIEREALGDVSDKTILHAQCHIGLDSMSLARLGARVTGVDFSEAAIAAARQFNHECGLNCRFICCNIYDLPAHLNEQFDMVYASYGVITWLPDLQPWCRILADRLRPGGTLLLIDDHPMCQCIEVEPLQRWPRVTQNYFTGKEMVFCPADQHGDHDYHATDKSVGKANYERAHSVADIINAVATAGLTIQNFREYTQGSYRMYPEMTKGPDGLFRLPAEKALIPLTFLLQAVKR